MPDLRLSVPKRRTHMRSRLSARNGNPVRVLAIASGGGHWMQLLRLRPALVGCRVTFASVRPASAVDVPGERFVLVPDANQWDRLRLAWMALRVAWLVLRERPDVVMSTGAAPGVVAVRVGKLIGGRTIWMDSIANIERLSMSGDLAGPHADLWLTQWPHLRRPGGPQCVGAVL